MSSTERQSLVGSQKHSSTEELLALLRRVRQHRSERERLVWFAVLTRLISQGFDPAFLSLGARDILGEAT